MGNCIRHRSRIQVGDALSPSFRLRRAQANTAQGTTAGRPASRAVSPEILRYRLPPGAVAAYRANQSAAKTIHRPIRRDAVPSRQATADCFDRLREAMTYRLRGFFVLLADAAA